MLRLGIPHPRGEVFEFSQSPGPHLASPILLGRLHLPVVHSEHACMYGRAVSFAELMKVLENVLLLTS
jgi:hypothetical protein